MIRRLLVLGLISSAALAQVVTYEGEALPEEVGWNRDDRLYPCDRRIEDGWLVQYGEIVQDQPVEFGEDDLYRRSIADFAGAQAWFVEWRMFTDGFPVYQDVAPSGLVAGGRSGITYHFTIGDVQIRFLRDVVLPFIFVDIEPGIAHTYRVELESGSYAVWVDGVLIDCGVPEGPFPVLDSVVVFGARASGEDSTTRWDYIRFGVIPADASGDFDSDGVVGPSDLPYFVECLTTDAGAWPGCRWADMDADGDVTVFDIAGFIDRFAQPGRDPRPEDRTP